MESQRGSSNASLSCRSHYQKDGEDKQKSASQVVLLDAHNDPVEHALPQPRFSDEDAEGRSGAAEPGLEARTGGRRRVLGNQE